jgi:predicted KAP-like P-loop ATPase
MWHIFVQIEEIAIFLKKGYININNISIISYIWSKIISQTSRAAINNTEPKG